MGALGGITTVGKHIKFLATAGFGLDSFVITYGFDHLEGHKKEAPTPTTATYIGSNGGTGGNGGAGSGSGSGDGGSGHGGVTHVTLSYTIGFILDGWGDLLGWFEEILSGFGISVGF